MSIGKGWSGSFFDNPGRLEPSAVPLRWSKSRTVLPPFVLLDSRKETTGLLSLACWWGFCKSTVLTASEFTKINFLALGAASGGWTTKKKAMFRAPSLFSASGNFLRTLFYSPFNDPTLLLAKESLNGQILIHAAIHGNLSWSVAKLRHGTGTQVMQVKVKFAL